jgi:acyl-coenzyme A thioesterase PaaI-like protein
MTSSTEHDLHERVRVARARAGRAIRRIGHSFVGRDNTAELLDEVSANLDRLSDRLDDGAARSRSLVDDGTWRHEVGDGEEITSYDERPFSGRASPWGLDLTVRRFGEEVEAHCTLDAAHEGAPGRCHGGIVAGLFDDVFGFVLGALREPAFTGELKVRYQAPTPLYRPLACRARLVERDGRKLHMAGELIDVDADLVVARSTAIMIVVDPSGFAGTQQLPAPPD